LILSPLRVFSLSRISPLILSDNAKLTGVRRFIGLNVSGKIP
jgi:hypothetical protein